MVSLTSISQILFSKICNLFNTKKANGTSPDLYPRKQYNPTLTPQKLHCIAPKLEELKNHTLIFNVEETLLKSNSLFPFFMLVALEGGGLLRAFILLFIYPFLSFVNKEWKLKIMVFICFFGIKSGSFSIGRTVLPKFFLENVGFQGFEIVMKFGNKVGVTNFPRVMVEGFLKDYLGIEIVYGKEIKEFEGYYLGLMENKVGSMNHVMQKFCNTEDNVVIISGCEKTLEIIQQFSTKIKDLYLVNEVDKEKWKYLSRDNYPKPLVFHDGRLAFMPTPLASLAMFMWLPFAIVLCITRIIVAIFLPYKISILLLSYLGGRLIKYPKQYHCSRTSNNGSKGLIYVCNHKTLIDPICVSLANGVHLPALTFGISKLSQFLSPIKTVVLTRNKEKDTKIMHQMLSKGSIVVCPEGTTCREPYLLRFSPLFAEITDDIVPVGLEVYVSMFYGTTASGIKAFDPLILLANPIFRYHVNFLPMVPKSHTCGVGGVSKFDVANYVQTKIGSALGYTCTSLSRKDKYMMLAGKVMP